MSLGWETYWRELRADPVVQWVCEAIIIGYIGRHKRIRRYQRQQGMTRLKRGVPLEEVEAAQ